MTDSARASNATSCHQVACVGSTSTWHEFVEIRIAHRDRRITVRITRRRHQTNHTASTNNRRSSCIRWFCGSFERTFGSWVTVAWHTNNCSGCHPAGRFGVNGCRRAERLVQQGPPTMYQSKKGRRSSIGFAVGSTSVDVPARSSATCVVNYVRQSGIIKLRYQSKR